MHFPRCRATAGEQEGFTCGGAECRRSCGGQNSAKSCLSFGPDQAYNRGVKFKRDSRLGQQLLFTVTLLSFTSTLFAAAPAITNIAMAGANPQLTIHSKVGLTNQIQYSTNLTQTIAFNIDIGT